MWNLSLKTSWSCSWRLLSVTQKNSCDISHLPERLSVLLEGRTEHGGTIMAEQLSSNISIVQYICSHLSVF